MGTKGERTRDQLIAQAAILFNVKGFDGTSMSDLTRATGLEKGGLYNHYPNKDALALASFWHAATLFYRRFEDAMAPCQGARERLQAMVASFGRLPHDPPVPGGCPLVKVALGTHQELKDAAQLAMVNWMRLIGRTVNEGVKSGEFGAGVDPRGVASLMVAALEGGLMLTLLYDEPVHLNRVVEHLCVYVNGL